MPKLISRDASMRMTKRCIFVILMFLQASCTQSDPAMKMYFCVNPKTSTEFTSELATILRRHGFDPAQGKAVDEYGHTNFVLEADARFVRIWAQNAPVDPPREVPNLQNYAAGLSVDPNQYVISVQARIPFVRSRARRTFESLRDELRRSGFRECSRVKPQLP